MEAGFETFAEVIDFAVMREEEAYEFYRDLSQKATDPFMKSLLSDFAQEELQHKQMLQNLDSGEGIERLFTNITKEVEGLKIAESKDIVEPSPDMDFKQTLSVAMTREDKSCRLYSLLAELSEDNHVSMLFIGLAKEEAHHKLRIEQAYQDFYGAEE